MATVDKMVGTKTIERFMAGIGPVQDALDFHAHAIFARAEVGLAAVRSEPGYTGNLNAELKIEHGDVDAYVVLHDPLDNTSPGAAASIEYGHYLGRRGLPGRPWIPGKWIVHDAAGIPRR